MAGKTHGRWSMAWTWALAALALGGPASALLGAGEPWAQRWIAAYDDALSRQDAVVALAAGPEGDRVFATGSSFSFGTSMDWATAALDAQTGARLWTRRLNGPGNGWDQGWAAATSPDGELLFVTGESQGVGTSRDFLTMALHAVDGTVAWSTRYNGPANAWDNAVDVAVSPDGARVFVTGYSEGAGTFGDYATLAYDAATGDELWVARYHHDTFDTARAVAVAPSGAAVYVTGGSFDLEDEDDFATVAYDALTGVQLWVARYHGSGDRFDHAVSVAVEPLGLLVFVTGGSWGGADVRRDYTTVAYDAVAGTQLWVARTDGPDAASDDLSLDVVANPALPLVHVTGLSSRTAATVTYTLGGVELWSARGAASFFAPTVRATPDGLVLVLAEDAGDVRTHAYDALSGEEAWSLVTGGPAVEVGRAMALAPDGSGVYVAGSTQEPGNVASARFLVVAHGSP